MQKSINTTKQSHRILDESLLETFFNIQLANNVRFNSKFTLVFLAFHPASKCFEEGKIDREQQTSLEQRMNHFLASQVRDADIIFHLPSEQHWIVFLTNSGEREAHFFLRRICNQLDLIEKDKAGEVLPQLVISVAEVVTARYPIEKVLSEGSAALKQAMTTDSFQIVSVNQFKERDPRDVKVSIIEEDEIVSQIIHNLLIRSSIQKVNLSIRTFYDGHAFLQSDWYQSSHVHLIIMNDILPKKNGVEILHALRQMPNHQKYIIFMMSKRSSEEDMIYVFENGVDEFIVKPFNVRLFVAQVKKVLKRL